MKNVLLFQPAMGYMDAMRTQPSIPINLLSCASIVSKYYKVNIVDQRIITDWQSEVSQNINSETICVGVTTYTGKMILQALEFSKFVKSKFNIPVVWGGVHASLIPAQTLENEYVDIVVEGEGEQAFFELVKALDMKAPIENIAGIWHKSEGIIKNISRPVLLDMERLPDIPYHLVDINNYLPEYRGRKSIFFQSSRGCPFECTYCYNTTYNAGKWRSYSANSVLGKIKRLLDSNKSIEDIYFIDDNFFIDFERARTIVEGLKNLGITYQLQGVDILALKRMDDTFLRLLQDSNCIRLTTGIESASERIRGMIHKNGTVDDILAVVEKLKKFNIILYCSFIIGFPDETMDDIKKSIELLFKMLKINKNIRNSPFFLYTPLPGTLLCDTVIKKGYKIPKKLIEWVGYEYSELSYKAKNKNILESIHFVSNFVDNKTAEYTVPFLIRLMTILYRPFARMRLKYLYFDFMVEKYIYGVIEKIWEINKPSHG